MKKIIYTRSDGGCAVIHPVIGTHPQRENITEDEALQRAWEKDIPADAINPQIVSAEFVPTDRSFRNAWIVGIQSIGFDMNKCREIYKQQLREIRAPKFAPLEQSQRTAFVTGDIPKALMLESKLQQLRDVTSDPAILAAQTPEELKTILPDCLK